MEYKLLVHVGPQELNKDVSFHLDNGWELYGNHSVTVTVVREHDYYKYCQVVIRKPYTDIDY